MDTTNQKIFDERMQARTTHMGPLVGDYIKTPDGDFTAQAGAGEYSSFYLMSNGILSYSGGLNTGG